MTLNTIEGNQNLFQLININHTILSKSECIIHRYKGSFIIIYLDKIVGRLPSEVTSAK